MFAIELDTSPDEIPEGLDRMEPGPLLGVILAAIDVNDLPGYDRIVVLRAHQRMASHYQAQIYRDMAAVTDHFSELDDDLQLSVESAAAEIRAALRLTRRAADAELEYALDLHLRLPRLRDALSAGDVDVRRAKVILHATCHLPIGVARNVVEEILPVAPTLTTGQLGARLRKLCIDVDPDDARERYATAVEERRVTSQPTESGTANLFGLDLPPHRVAAAMARINELARSLRRPGEARSMDQLRADVLLDLLEGTKDHAISRGSSRGTVDLHVDLETLAGLADRSGELAGYGPVIADIARQVTEQQSRAEWRFTVTDSASGQPLHTGITRRRPAAAARRYVEARDRTCIFPGCRMAATASDLDHRIPWSEGGPTSITHLAPACRHDHGIRHRCGWRYRPLENGDYEWTSRLGHRYTTSGRSP